MTLGVVEAFSVYLDCDGYGPIWWQIKLKDSDKPVLLHNNWMSERGELKVGDHVEYELAGSTWDGHAVFMQLHVVKTQEDIVSLMGEAQK